MPISNKLIASSLLSVNEDKLPIPIVAFTGNPILPSLSSSGSILFSEQYEIFVEYTAGSVAPEVGGDAPTFPNGDTVYDFIEETLQNLTTSDEIEVISQSSDSGFKVFEGTPLRIAASYSPPTDYEVYQIDYSCEYDGKVRVSGTKSSGFTQNMFRGGRK